MGHPLVYCVLSGLFFGAWPAISKLSKLPTDWLVVTVSVLTAVVSLLGLNLRSNIPNPGSLSIGAVAGILNGLGFLAYGVLLGYQGKDLPKFLAIAAMIGFVIMIVSSSLILDGTSLSYKKILGLVLACVSIYLLNN